MRVKCLAQEHNAAPRSGLKPGMPNPESRTLTIRPRHLPQVVGGDLNYISGGPDIKSSSLSVKTVSMKSLPSKY